MTQSMLNPFEAQLAYVWMCWNVWCLCMNVLECMMFMLIDMSNTYECFVMHEGIHTFDM